MDINKQQIKAFLDSKSANDFVKRMHIRRQRGLRLYKEIKTYFYEKRGKLTPKEVSKLTGYSVLKIKKASSAKSANDFVKKMHIRRQRGLKIYRLLKKRKAERCYEVVVNGIMDLPHNEYKEIDDYYVYLKSKDNAQDLAIKILTSLEDNGIDLYRTAKMRLEDKDRVYVALRTAECENAVSNIDDVISDIITYIQTQPKKVQKKYSENRTTGIREMYKKEYLEGK